MSSGAPREVLGRDRSSREGGLPKDGPLPQLQDLRLEHARIAPATAPSMCFRVSRFTNNPVQICSHPVLTSDTPGSEVVQYAKLTISIINSGARCTLSSGTPRTFYLITRMCCVSARINRGGNHSSTSAAPFPSHRFTNPDTLRVLRPPHPSYIKNSTECIATGNMHASPTFQLTALHIRWLLLHDR